MLGGGWGLLAFAGSPPLGLLATTSPPVLPLGVPTGTMVVLASGGGLLELWVKVLKA